MNRQAIEKLVRSWVMTAADHIRQGVDQGLTVNEKTSHQDIVTNLDQETERYLRQQIQDHFPDDRIIGEEGEGKQSDSLEGSVWIIDPIDGTANFYGQRRHFAIMLARYVDGEGQFGVIYDVVNDDYVTAWQGQGVTWNGQPFTKPFDDKPLRQGLIAGNGPYALHNTHRIQDFIDQALGFRIYGSAGLQILYVLRGDLLLYFSPKLAPWDVAAGSVIAREAGLNFSQFDGSKLDLLHKGSGVIGYPSAYQQFVKYLAVEAAWDKM